MIRKRICREENDKEENLQGKEMSEDNSCGTEFVKERLARKDLI